MTPAEEVEADLRLARLLEAAADLLPAAAGAYLGDFQEYVGVGEPDLAAAELIGISERCCAGRASWSAMQIVAEEGRGREFADELSRLVAEHLG